MPLLEWSDKQKAIQAAKQSPYRLLVENPEYSYSAASQPASQPANYTENDDLNQQLDGNIIIQGDNLDALKSLLPFYAGSIKCIFIDPPYNTQKAFTHYDDGLEHSIWLNMMYPRLELLHEMLAEDGSIWITIDDREAHYLKVMCDEIFGRDNFVANAVWEKKYSPQNDAKYLSDNHDHIFCYAKHKRIWRPNLLQRSDEAVARYKNPDNDPRGVWKATDFSVKTYSAANDYPITTPTGRVVNPPASRCWVTSKSRFEELLLDNRIWFGKTGNNVPALKTFLSEAKSGTTCLTIWKRDDVGDNQDAKKEVKAFNSEDVFDTPKPERLLKRIFELSTNPGDLVLDSFAGSGTTAAVAHKMNRRYIGIDIGNHAKTHIVPRLRQVIDGEQGGVSQTVGWNGGGSFRFYELGENIFNHYGDINEQVSFDGLAAFIWFHITHRPLSVSDGLKPNTPLIGVHEGTAYYLLYNGILGDRRPQGGNVLTRKILSELPDLERFVSDSLKITVYGEACRLGGLTLEQKRITFKQIPYHVTDK